MKRIPFLLLCFITLSHCQMSPSGDQVENYAKTEAAYDEDTPQEKESLNDQQSQQNDRKIIRTAEYRFQVKDVEKSTEYIKNVVATFNGFIAQMDQRNNNYSISSDFTIKAPSDKFEPLLNALGEEAIFTNFKRIKSEDVSTEYVDIQARLKTKKEVRDRYVEILRNKAGNVKDILDAEEKIRVIQEEIESREARLRYLQAQVKYSTIHLNIYQKVEFKTRPVVYKESFLAKVRKNFISGWNAILNIVLVFVNIWPLLIFILLIFWQRKRIFRNFYKS